MISGIIVVVLTVVVRFSVVVIGHSFGMMSFILQALEEHVDGFIHPKDPMGIAEST